MVRCLEERHHQVRHRHDRQRAGHDADIPDKPRQLTFRNVPQDTDKRRGGQHLPDAHHAKRAEQRDGDKVVRRPDAALALGGELLREDRYSRDAKRVAHRRKKIERGVIGRGIEVRVDAGAEIVGLEHLAHDAEELGNEREDEDKSDRACRSGRCGFSGGGFAFLLSFHDVADHLLVCIKLLLQPAHIFRNRRRLLFSRFQNAGELRLERLCAEGLARAEAVKTDRVQKRRAFRVVGNADDRNAHDGGIDHGVQAHAHKNVHIADDREHILGKILFAQALCRAVRPLRDHGADLAVLLIMERDQDRFGVVVLPEPADTLRDLAHEGAVPVFLADRPADRQSAVLFDAGARKDLSSDRPVRSFHANDRVRRNDDPLLRKTDLLKELGRALVAHDDAVRLFQRPCRGTAVEGMVDRSDALRINEHLFAQQLGKTDDEQVVMDALAARHVLQKAPAAGDEHVALPDRAQDRPGRHALHRLNTVLFPGGGGVVRKDGQSAVGNFFPQARDERAQDRLVADVVKAVIAGDQNVIHGCSQTDFS